jgi:uncharacterized membrane protein
VNCFGINVYKNFTKLKKGGKPMRFIDYAALTADILQIIDIVVPFLIAHPIISLVISNVVTLALLLLFIIFFVRSKTKKDRSPSHDQSAA